jgi:hypothetical protein
MINDHHGFASKNFYSEFLALVHVLAYKEIIFDKIDFDTSSFPSLNVYSTLLPYFTKVYLWAIYK